MHSLSHLDIPLSQIRVDFGNLAFQAVLVIAHWFVKLIILEIIDDFLNISDDNTLELLLCINHRLRFLVQEIDERLVLRLLLEY